MHRDTFIISLACAVTLTSADWFSKAVSQSLVFFCAQNYLNYQVNKNEMKGENVDTILILSTVAKSMLICFLFSAISYAMFSS